MTQWIRFNLVGVMGFSLQTLALWLLVRGAGLSAGVAITIAVLAAVSHNFVWHERFTWPNLPREKRFRGFDLDRPHVQIRRAQV